MRRGGFGLLETLIAAGLLGLLLVLLGAQLASSRRAARGAEIASDARRLLHLAGDLLREEVASAGWTGADPAVRAVTDLGGPPLELLERGPGQDAVRVRYLDDRYLGEPKVRVVTYSAGRDRRGLPSLYRQEGGAPRQPAVVGVAGLDLVGWVAEGGAIGGPDGTPDGPVAALLLALTDEEGGRHLLALAFGTPATAAVEP